MSSFVFVCFRIFKTLSSCFFIFETVYIRIYIFKNIYVFNMCIYITNIGITENCLGFQKDAHQCTDHFASPEMSVRVDFDG